MIRLFDLATGRELGAALRAPRAAEQPVTFDGRRMLYVRSTYRRQELRLGILRRRATTRDQLLYRTTPTGRRDAGRREGPPPPRAGYPGGKAPNSTRARRPGVTDTLWTTALGPTTAYVTRLRLRRGRHHGDDLVRPALAPPNVNSGWVGERGASRGGGGRPKQGDRPLR